MQTNGKAVCKHTLKLSHSLQKDFGSPYEQYLEYLLDITVGFDLERVSRDTFDTAEFRNHDKSPKWALWLRDSIWQKFKKCRAVLRQRGFTVTNSQLVRILLGMKKQMNIPDPIQFNLANLPEYFPEAGITREICSDGEKRSPYTDSEKGSPYPVKSEADFEHHHLPIFENAQALVIMHSIKKESDEEPIIENSKSLPNWLSMIIN
jgi:hypothetical protein